MLGERARQLTSENEPNVGHLRGHRGDSIAGGQRGRAGACDEQRHRLGGHHPTVQTSRRSIGWPKRLRLDDRRHGDDRVARDLPAGFQPGRGFA